MALIPGSTEYGLMPEPVTRQITEGEHEAENRHVLHARSDIVARKGRGRHFLAKVLHFMNRKDELLFSRLPHDPPAETEPRALAPVSELHFAAKLAVERRMARRSDNAIGIGLAQDRTPFMIRLARAFHSLEGASTQSRMPSARR